MGQDQELFSDAAAAFASWSHQGSTRNCIFDQINWGYKVGICTFWKKVTVCTIIMAPTDFLTHTYRQRSVDTNMALSDLKLFALSLEFSKNV